MTQHRFPQFLVLTAILAALGASATAAQAPDFTGTFRSERASIEISAAQPGSSARSGTIRLKGRSFAFRAKQDGDVLEGSFVAGKARFAFSAELADDVLQFRSGRTRLTMTRAGVRKTAKNPFDELEPAANEAKRPRVSTAATRTIRHPGGFELRIPKDWREQSQASPVAGAGVLSAMPAGANAANASAMVLITALPLQGAFAGIRGPDDPKLRELGVFPKLAPGKAPQRVQLPFGAARVTEYRGNMTAGQGEVRARLHLWVQNGQLVSCLAVAKDALFAKHDTAFLAIAKSLRPSKRTAQTGQSAKIPAIVRDAPRDPKLVGTWRNTNSRVVRGLPGDSMAISTDIFCTLSADGRYRYGAGRTGFAASNKSGSSTGMTGRGKVETGYWKSEGKNVFYMAEGSTTWVRLGRYGISGRSMLIYYPNGNKVLWER